jgi:hypothetical protein
MLLSSLMLVVLAATTLCGCATVTRAFSRVAATVASDTAGQTWGSSASSSTVATDATGSPASRTVSAPNGETPTTVLGSLATAVSSPSPLQHDLETVTATVKDAGGRPIYNIRVKFVWRFKGSTKTYYDYTNRSGVAVSISSVGSLSNGYHVKVACSTKSGDVIKRTTATFTPAAPKLGSLAVVVFDPAPAQKTVETATATCRDARGRPLSGVRVTFVWTKKSGTVSRWAPTDSAGIARCKFNVGAATPGYRIVLRCTAKSGGVAKSASASFVPN